MALLAIVQYLDGVVRAAAAATGNAQPVAEVIQVVRAVGGGSTYVPVSDGVANTDVHGSVLRGCSIFKR